MHPALRKGPPLFYKTPPFSTFLQKKHTHISFPAYGPENSRKIHKQSTTAATRRQRELNNNRIVYPWSEGEDLEHTFDGEQDSERHVKIAQSIRVDLVGYILVVVRIELFTVTRTRTLYIRRLVSKTNRLRCGGSTRRLVN